MIEVRRSPAAAREALAKRRADAQARARDHIEILRLSAAKRRHERAADALQRVLVAGKCFVFDTVASIFEPQPWAVGAGGSVLGHLLAIDDETFDRIADDCEIEVLSIPDALDRSWPDFEQRSAWAATYTDSLRALADREEQRDGALRQQRDLLAVVPRADKT
jgi:hypothetical protein